MVAVSVRSPGFRRFLPLLRRLGGVGDALAQEVVADVVGEEIGEGLAFSPPGGWHCGGKFNCNGPGCCATCRRERVAAAQSA